MFHPLRNYLAIARSIDKNFSSTETLAIVCPSAANMRNYDVLSQLYDKQAVTF